METDLPVLQRPPALLDVLLLPLGDAPLLEQLVQLLRLHQHELLVVDLKLLDESAHLPAANAAAVVVGALLTNIQICKKKSKDRLRDTAL